MLMHKLKCILCIVSFAVVANAQSADQELEELYDRIESKEEKRKAKKRKKRRAKRLKKKMATLSDLGVLAPFEDIAVIQKRYLPRTGRFELSGLGGLSTNNKFFNNFAIALKGAYFFKEEYGIEASYVFLNSSERPITEGLRKNQQVATASLVEPESYMGIAFKWSPYYGKIAWFEEKIIPFDIYLTPGIGITSTALGEDETTFSLGAGQIFAISKSAAIRWDLTWNFYQATVQLDTGKDTQNNNDLLLMIGYSFFFPEATYR